MRILFLSPVHPLLTRSEPLPRWQMQMSWVRGLRQLGHEVKVVRYTPQGHFRLSPGERLIYNLESARSAIGSTVDLVIYSLGADVLLPLTLRFIKVMTGAPLAVLSGVSPITDGNPRDRGVAKYVDLAATNDDGHTQEWLELGARRAVTLPISAMDPKLHYPRKEKKGLTSQRRGQTLRDARDIDVLFAGTVTAQRRPLFNKLKDLLHPKVKFVVRHHVWEEEYAELMSRAKIVLNPLRPEMRHGANLRMFEIPAFGAFQLASSGRKEWLEPGEEIVVYRDAMQAAGLVRRYLWDEKARLSIARTARKRVLKEHTFRHRADRLVNLWAAAVS